MVGRNVFDSLERLWKVTAVAYFNLDWLPGTEENPTPRTDSNTVFPEYEAEIPTTCPLRSVIVFTDWKHLSDLVQFSNLAEFSVTKQDWWSLGL
jgi:hypothetical protein